jgi:hypothetical protein
MPPIRLLTPLTVIILMPNEATSQKTAKIDPEATPILIGIATITVEY